jgi:hypothetical protein
MQNSAAACYCRAKQESLDAVMMASSPGKKFDLLFVGQPAGACIAALLG